MGENYELPGQGPGFTNWLKNTNNIDASAYNKYSLEEKNALQDSYNKLYGANTGLSGNSYTQYMNDPALGGLGIGLTKGGLKDFGMGVDILSTGHDLYSNLLGDKHDMYKLQKSAFKQNMANIAEDRANHQTYVKNIGGGINSAFGNGLAANAAKVG